MEPGLGQRVARFVALISLIVGIVGVVVVSERLSQDALALTLGLACGVAAMAPTVLLAVLLWRRAERSAVQSAASAPAAQPYAPPVIVVAPPALPAQNADAYRTAALNPAWMPGYPAERKFTIVGED